MKDYKKILGREIDEQNRTIFVIENMDGIIERVLYSEIDQKRVRNEFQENNFTRTTYITKFFDGTRLKVKNYDEHGNHIDVDMELERDKFINPHKYGKKGNA